MSLVEKGVENLKRIKQTTHFLLVLLVASFIFPVSQASAAPKLEVQATVGINGKAKYQSVVPLKVTVKNNGDNFSGDMAINALSSYEVGSAIILPLDLAKGQEKTIELYVEGLADYSMPNDSRLFAFFESGIEKGKEVSYKGTKQVQVNYLEPSSTFIYTLSKNSDRLAAYLRLSQLIPSSNVEVFNLNRLQDYTLPDDVQGYKMANIIAIDEFALGDLSQKQQEALFNWVQDGGTLLFGATDQVEATAGVFTDYLPLTFSEQMITVSAESLTKLSEGGTFTSPISVYKATENSGSIRVMTDDNTILAAKKKVGSGEIIQTTFSLGDNPLASMSGYAALTAKLVNIENSMQQRMMNRNTPLEWISYDLRQLNELFPSFEVSFTYMLVVILLYLLFIGPILYTVLKKVDKREYAWWLIPAISVVLSIALFMFGAKDRLLQPQVQQSAFYKVNEDQSVNGYYIESILTNRSGDFEVETDISTTASAFPNSKSFDGTRKNLYEASYSKQHENGSTLTLRDLSYWSVQSYAGKTTAQNIGNMTIDLTLKNENLNGTVKNNFPFTLKDVTLISGIKEVVLGDIEPNETLQVNRELQTTMLQKPSMNRNRDYMVPTKKEEIDPYRTQSMKLMAMSLTEKDPLPVVTAWADQAIAGVKLQSNANIAPISYFIQPFEGKVELTGPFTMKRTDFTYTFVSQSPDGYFDMYDEKLNTGYMQTGVYDVKVAMAENFVSTVQSFNELTISNNDSKRMKLSIWNNQTSTFEPIPDTKQVFTETSRHYFNQQGELLLQIKCGPDETGETTTLPDLELKGVAK